MAGTAYTSFAVGDSNIDAVMLNLAGINTGYNALTLTQMSTTTVPAIAAGSKIEVGGTLFKFDSEEAISGSPSDGTVFIMLIPSGSSITAQFTNTAPTWSDSKQGWYGTGGSAGYRYWPGKIVKASSTYTKELFSTSLISQSTFSSSTGALTTPGIVGNLALFTGVSVLTGSLSTSPATVSYPSGFTVSNTVIISLMALDGAAEWATPGAGFSGTGGLMATMTSGNISIIFGSIFNGQSYRLILAKIS